MQVRALLCAFFDVLMEQRSAHADSHFAIEAACWLLLALLALVGDADGGDAELSDTAALLLASLHGVALAAALAQDSALDRLTGHGGMRCCALLLETLLTAGLGVADESIDALVAILEPIERQQQPTAAIDLYLSWTALHSYFGRVEHAASAPGPASVGMDRLPLRVWLRQRTSNALSSAPRHADALPVMRVGRAHLACHTLALERCSTDSVLWNTSHAAPPAAVADAPCELVIGAAPAGAAHFHVSLEGDAAAFAGSGPILVRRAYESTAPDAAMAAAAVAAAALHRPLGGAGGSGGDGITDVAGMATWRVPRNALIIVTIQLIGAHALAAMDDRCLLVVTDHVPSGLLPLSVCTPSGGHGKWWEEAELRAGRVQLTVRASVLRRLHEGLGSVRAVDPKQQPRAAHTIRS